MQCLNPRRSGRTIGVTTRETAGAAGIAANRLLLSNSSVRWPTLQLFRFRTVRREIDQFEIHLLLEAI
jgi:hypothetical protein